MNIRTKAGSDEMITKLGMNKMLEHKGMKGLEEFLSASGHEYYNIRDKSTAMGNFQYKLTGQEVLEVAPKYLEFSVYESLAEADKGLVLQGEIQIDSGFNMVASLSNLKEISNRKAMELPQITICTNLVEGKMRYVPGLDQVIDFMCENDIIGPIMEFTLYNQPVGVNEEELLIWELRNY